MTEQNAIIEFLNQRYDEEEQAARTAGEAVGYSWVSDGDLIALSGKPEGSNYVEGMFLEHGVESAHIALHDPARALLEVESKRLLIAEHVGYYGEGPDENWPVCAFSSCSGVLQPPRLRSELEHDMSLPVTLVSAYLVFLAFAILVWFTAGAGEPLAAAVLIGAGALVVGAANWAWEKWFAAE